MDKDNFEDTQWTEKAKRAYQQRGDKLVEALRAHVTANVNRTGRQKELQPCFESADSLRSAVRAFDEAEFDWCGSFPLGIGPDDEDEGDDPDEWDDATPQGNVLSVLGRWDYRITDEAAVIAAGRAAYLRASPDDTEADAEIRVQEVGDAASELHHADGFQGLEAVDGLQLERDATARRTSSRHRAGR